MKGIFMNCLLCQSKIKAFGSKKIHSGKICKACVSKLPSLIFTKRTILQEYALKMLMNKTEENVKNFCATASYGQLHIDEIHGLFAISKRLNKDGKLIAGNNVFSVYGISEIGLFCTSPRMNNNQVFVDVEFRCVIESPNVSFSTIVKRGAKCHIKHVKYNEIEWEEPGDFLMFRTMFNGMLSGAFAQVSQMLCGRIIHDFEIEKARSIFMLPEDYTATDLKKARRLMMKVYHPDIAEDDVTREAQIINDAYDLLKAELEQKNKPKQ
jgi:hypothetical protein